MRFTRIEVRGEAAYAELLPDGRARPYTAPPYAGGRATEDIVADPVPLAPVTPSKIVCVGRNYRAHAEELGHEVPSEPLLFMKPPSALLPPGGTIVRPPESARVDYEGELAVVIGQRLTHASPETAIAGIFGGTCANDVTARDLQRKDVQFTRAKGFDSFCPCGPWVETELPPWDALRIETRVDGVVRQAASTGQMLFPVGELLSYISRIMTLEPGDLVLTGTPEGVGPLEKNQQVAVAVSGIGELSNPVA